MKRMKLTHNNYMAAIGGVVVRTKKYVYVPSRVRDDDTIAAWWQFPVDVEYMYIGIDERKSRYDEMEIVEK